MICPRCSGSTIYRDENGIPQTCCRTGIVPTEPYSPESAMPCATLPWSWDRRTEELVHPKADPPWLKAPVWAALGCAQCCPGHDCPPACKGVRAGELRPVPLCAPSAPSDLRSPNIAAWLAGGCMVCGSLLRDGKVYAHNACCDRTDPETFGRWTRLCCDAESAPSAPTVPGVGERSDSDALIDTITVVLGLGSHSPLGDCAADIPEAINTIMGERDSSRAEVEKWKERFDEYAHRLAGALTAAEGHHSRAQHEALSDGYIKGCPTIGAVIDLRERADASRAEVEALKADLAAAVRNNAELHEDATLDHNRLTAQLDAATARATALEGALECVADDLDGRVMLQDEGPTWEKSIRKFARAALSPDSRGGR